MKKILIITFILLIAISGYSINIPTQSSPANGAVNQLPNVTLWINTVTGATFYDYMLDTTSLFNSPAVRNYTHSGSYSGWTPNDLFFGKTYYWKIRARNANETSDWSSVWSFSTTLIGATQSSPNEGSVDRGVSLSLYINKYGCRNYDYQLDTLPTFDSPGLRNYTHSDSYSGQTVVNLDYRQKYYWRVRGRNAADTSIWTETWNFTTSESGAWQSSPSNNSIDRAVSLTLSVNKLTGSSYIDYQLDTLPTFNSEWLREYSHTDSYSGQTVVNLDYGQKYYWRVRGRNGADTSVWTEAWNFTTEEMGAWQSSPTNNSTDRAVSLTLNVNKLTGSSFIDYQLDTVPNFNSEWLREYSHTDSYSGQSVVNLNYGQKYYWRVRGRNAADTSIWTETWNFTTSESGAWQSSPSNNSTDRAVSLTLNINKLSGSSYIDYQLDTIPTFNSEWLREYSHTDSYSGQSVVNLDYGQKYYWRVRGRNAADTSIWTETWNFTTDEMGAWQSSPSNNSTDRAVSLTLNVNKLTGSSYIDYQLDTVPSFNSEWLREYSHTDSYSGQSVVNLNYGQKYYWRVRGRNAADTSIWTEIWNFTTDEMGAWQSSPSNGSVGRPIDLTLYISKLTGDEFIDYQLDTTPYFNSGLLRNYSHNSSYSGQIVNNLRYGQEYYWHVRGRHSLDTSMWSANWKFTTQYELLNGPTLVSPENGSTNLSYSSVNLIWNSLTNADTYQYQVSEDIGFTQIIKSGNTSLTFTVVSELYPARVYYWRVRGENTNGYSPWSEYWNFTTESVVLSAPILNSPENGANNVSINPTFDWNDVFGATGYTMQISIDNNFSTGVSTYYLTNSNHSISGLMNDFTFYWRVKATENSNESPWSEVWSFTTGIQTLDAPVLISPENGATNVSINPTFDWNDVFGATGYTMQISIDNSFLSGVSTYDLTNSNHTISGLMYDNTFYWRVKATENNNESPWSEVWSFTTEIQTLDAPILISPENNAVDIDSLSVEFEWHVVSEANAYTIEISQDESFTNMFYTETTVNSSITKGDFNCGTVYYWRLKASNGSITSNWSEIRQFTIADCVGVESLFEDGILVYPNPSNDIVRIKHPFQSPEKIELIDISGKTIPCSYLVGISEITVDISKIPEGLYQLRLLTNNRYFNIKIIKTK